MKKNEKSVETSISVLIEAISNLHGCKAVWLESVSVKEVFQSKTVWEGVVQVFELIDHPTATRAYAWSYVSDKNTGNRRFYAVLHQGPVDSPQAAVRAAIVAEYRKEKGSSAKKVVEHERVVHVPRNRRSR